MSRNATGKIKLKIPAGSATMGGTIAPALGQKGVKAKDFVDAFNAQTGHLPKGTPVHTTIYVMKDKSFTFTVNTESTSDRIKKALNITKCAQKPGLENIATLSKAQIEEIAKDKLNDTNASSLEQMCKIITGTAKSMGIEVK